MNANELVERYGRGERDFRGVLLRHAELPETMLSRADLRDADLTGVNLCGADLSRTELTHATLFRANLEGADLRRANLRWALLSESMLHAADLSWANLQGAALRGTNLCEAKLHGAGLCHADLGAAILTRADFTGAKLCAANLRGTHPEQAILVDADLTGVVFDLTDAVVRSQHSKPPRGNGLDPDERARSLWRSIVEEHRNSRADFQSTRPVGRIGNPPDGVSPTGAWRGAMQEVPDGLLFGAVSGGLAALAQADRLSVLLLGAAGFGFVTLAGALKGYRDSRK